MPLSKYFKGDGPQVMSDMQRRYGAERGKRIFYATAAKKGMKPSGSRGTSSRHRLAQARAQRKRPRRRRT